MSVHLLPRDAPRAPAAAVTTIVWSRPRKHVRTHVRSTAPTCTGPGDVRGIATGLFCRDIQARGDSYSAAVDHWRLHGQPNRMDIDLNGIPQRDRLPAVRRRHL
jgi:hypothetical protein